MGPFSTEEESPTAENARLLAQKEELCRTLHGKLAQVRSLLTISPHICLPLWLALEASFQPQERMASSRK